MRWPDGHRLNLALHRNCSSPSLRDRDGRRGQPAFFCAFCKTADWAFREPGGDLRPDRRKAQIMTPATLRFPVLFLITLAFGSLALAALARAENGMEWQFFQSDDPGNKSHAPRLWRARDRQCAGQRRLRAQLERGRKFLHCHLRRRYRRSPERQGYRAARVGRWLRSRAQGQDLSRHRRRGCERGAGGYRQRRSAVAGLLPRRNRSIIWCRVTRPHRST